MREGTGGWDPFVINYFELANWAWTLARLLEEITQMMIMGQDGYRETERVSGYFDYFKHGMNLLDLSVSLAPRIWRGLRHGGRPRRRRRGGLWWWVRFGVVWHRRGLRRRRARGRSGGQCGRRGFDAVAHQQRGAAPGAVVGAGAGSRAPTDSGARRSRISQRRCGAGLLLERVARRRTAPWNFRRKTRADAALQLTRRSAVVARDSDGEGGSAAPIVATQRPRAVYKTARVSGSAWRWSLGCGHPQPRRRDGRAHARQRDDRARRPRLLRAHRPAAFDRADAATGRSSR